MKNKYKINNISLYFKETKVSDATISKVYLYFGTDGNGITTPQNIINGKILSYRIIELYNLDYDKTYYLQLIPENIYGEKQLNTPIWVIKTSPKPIYKPDYFEDFDKNIFYIPLGWNYFERELNDSVVITEDFNGNWFIGNFLNHNDSTRTLNYNIFLKCNGWIVTPNIILEDTIHKYYLTFDFGLTQWRYNLPDVMAPDDSVGVFITKDNYFRKNDVLLWITSKDSIKMFKNYQLAIPLKFYNDTIRIGFYAYSGKSNTDIDIFIDNFGVKKKSENSFIDTIKLDSKIFTKFVPTNYSYVVYLNENDSIPYISAVPQDKRSNVKIIQAKSLNDTAKIIVTAENPNFKSIYCIVFKTLSKNAFLSDLKLNNQTIDGFDPQKQKYTVEFNQWDNIPFVTAIAQDSCARVEIIQPSKLPDTVVVKVIAEDTSVINYYYVLLLVKTGVENSISNNLRVYPNPAKNYIYVEGVEILGTNLILMDLSGKILFERRLINGSNLINVESLQKGVYLLKILNDSNVKVLKFIKE